MLKRIVCIVSLGFNNLLILIRPIFKLLLLYLSERTSTAKSLDLDTYLVATLKILDFIRLVVA